MHLSENIAMHKTATWKAWARVHSFARNGRTKFVLKVLITAVVLFVLFRAIDPDLVLQRLATVDPTFLALAMMLAAARACPGPGPSARSKNASADSPATA